MKRTLKGKKHLINIGPMGKEESKNEDGKVSRNFRKLN